MSSDVQRRFLAYQHRLQAYLSGLLRNPHDAEDCFQEVALVILNHPKGPDDPEAFPAWARGIARHHALHLWRRERRSRCIGDGALVDLVDRSFAEADSDPDSGFALRAALSDCLDRLDERQRHLLSARYVDGSSLEDLAVASRTTADGLRMLLQRLREKLRRCIEAGLKTGMT